MAAHRQARSAVQLQPNPLPPSACCMHIIHDCNEETKLLTKTTWNTFRDIAKEWLEIGGKEAKVIHPEVPLDREYEQLDSIPAYHKACYKRFTDKQQLFYAKKRREKAELSQTPDSTGRGKGKECYII